MNIESTAITIKKLWTIVSGKTDDDLLVSYSGTGYGQQNPWLVRIGNREIKGKTFDAAVETLRDELLAELQKKAVDTAKEAERLSAALNSLSN